MAAAKALSKAAKRGLARAPKSDTLVVYADQGFEETSLDLIIAANEVIARYSGRLSLRQLYYRLVARQCAGEHVPELQEFRRDRQRPAEANSVQEVDVWDELVPYVSETARVVGGSYTNREAVSGWGKATENAVPVRSCKERDTP